MNKNFTEEFNLKFNASIFNIEFFKLSESKWSSLEYIPQNEAFSQWYKLWEPDKCPIYNKKKIFNYLKKQTSLKLTEEIDLSVDTIISFPESFENTP
jgi:hypothetical protein